MSSTQGRTKQVPPRVKKQYICVPAGSKRGGLPTSAPRSPSAYHAAKIKERPVGDGRAPDASRTGRKVMTSGCARHCDRQVSIFGGRFRSEAVAPALLTHQLWHCTSAGSKTCTSDCSEAPNERPEVCSANESSTGEGRGKMSSAIQEGPRSGPELDVGKSLDAARPQQMRRTTGSKGTEGARLGEVSLSRGVANLGGEGVEDVLVALLTSMDVGAISCRRETCTGGPRSSNTNSLTTEGFSRLYVLCCMMSSLNTASCRYTLLERIVRRHKESA